MQPLKKTVLSFSGFFHANKAEPAKSFPLYDLPNDILTVVFGFLSQDLRKIGSTCRRYRKITQMHENFVLGNLKGKYSVLNELFRIVQQCQNDKSFLAQISSRGTDNFVNLNTTEINQILEKAKELELLNSREIKSDVKLFSECENAMQKLIDAILSAVALKFRFYSCLKIEANADDFRTRGIYDALKKMMDKHIASSDFSFVAPTAMTNLEITAYTPLMFYNTLRNLRYFRRINFDVPVQGSLSPQIFSHMNRRIATMNKVESLCISHTQKDHFDWFSSNRLEFLKTGVSKMAELEFLELKKSEWTTSDINEEHLAFKTLADIVLFKEKKKLKRIVFWGPWHIENITHFIGLLENYSHTIKVCNTQLKSFDTDNLAQIVKKNKKIDVHIRLEDTTRRTTIEETQNITEVTQFISTYSLIANLKKKK